MIIMIIMIIMTINNGNNEYNLNKNNSVLTQVLIDCKVTSVEKNLVSWFLVRTSPSTHTLPSPFPQSTISPSASPSTALSQPPRNHLSLLTVGFQTYASDPRN